MRIPAVGSQKSLEPFGEKMDKVKDKYHFYTVKIVITKQNAHEE